MSYNLHIQYRTLILAVAGVIAGIATAHATGPLGPEKLIFDSQAQGCVENDIVDAPLHAVRMSSGEVFASAGWVANLPFRGRSLTELKKDCTSAYVSKRNSDAAAFDDWTWLVSFWTPNGRTIFSLAHMEFQANRFRQCNFNNQLRCTYAAVIPYRSDNAGRSFYRMASRPIAAARVPFRRDQDATVGFRHPTNILRNGQYYYAMLEARAAVDQKAGACLFRTPDIAKPEEWEYLTDNGWQKSSFSAYARSSTPPPCKPLSRLSGIVWSLLRYKPTGQFLALVSIASKQPDRVDLALSTSSDLINWSEPRRFTTIIAAWNQECSKFKYNYPSILDDKSESANFDVVGETALLFMSRMSIEQCRGTMTRDLVVRTISLKEILGQN